MQVKVILDNFIVNKIIKLYNYLIAPKLIKSINQINQTEGAKFRVLCSIEKGSTPLFFQWAKNDEIISSRPETTYKIETSDELSIISIASVQRKDSGNYSCFVRNAFGTDFQSVVLNVRGI